MLLSLLHDCLGLSWLQGITVTFADDACEARMLDNSSRKRMQRELHLSRKLT